MSSHHFNFEFSDGRREDHHGLDLKGGIELVGSLFEGHRRENRSCDPNDTCPVSIYYPNLQPAADDASWCQTPQSRTEPREQGWFERNKPDWMRSYGDGYQRTDGTIASSDCPRQQTWPEIGSVTMTGPNGSEYTLDKNNHMTAMCDEAHRNFSFGWDLQSKALNFVHNEEGDWVRGKGCQPGEYTNTWTNQRTQATWTGDVHVGTVKDGHGHSQVGYSFDDGQTKQTYTIDGVKSESTSSDGQPCKQISTDASGYTTTEDFRTHFTKKDDPKGHTMWMTMTDAANHKVRFSNFDQSGNAGMVEDASGQWKHVQGNEWSYKHMVDGKMRADRKFGEMQVNMDQGWYKWHDQSNYTNTHYSDGTSSYNYNGNTMVTRPDRSTTGYDSDGNEFPCDPINGSVKYDVRNGVTVRAHLALNGAQLDSTGNMRMDANAPINAFEPGICVYSSGDKKNVNYTLLPEDVGVIKDLESQGKNVVVVENHTGRYDIYSGLGRATPMINQFIDRNTIIGQADDSGVVNFSVRRQRVSGQAVPVSSS